MGIGKTKAQLLAELEELRAYVANLEQGDARQEQSADSADPTNGHPSLLAGTPPIIPFTMQVGDSLAVVYMDPMVTEVTGYQPDDFTSDSSFWVDRIHPDDCERIISGLPEVLADGRHERVYRWRVADGSYRWFWDTLRLVELPDGARYVSGASLDITTQKQVKEKLRTSQGRLQNILDSASSAIISVDRDHRIILFNRQAERTFGYRAEEILGQPLNILIPEQFQAAHTKHVAKFAGEETAWRTMSERPLPISGRRKDGQVFPAEVAISRFVDGEQPIFTAVLNDITRRKQAEDELAARNHELDAYNHTIAHDLKAPMSLVAGYANLVLTDFENIDPQAREYLHAIQSTAMKMGKMVDQLLWLSRARDKSAPIECVEMVPVVQAALDRFRGRLDERGFVVTVAPDLPPAMGHDLWVEEVFANLISNAIKYVGRDNLSPRIDIRGKSNGRYVRYEVRDNGVGISSADQQALFGEFLRFHRDHQEEGLGLGLSIIYRIVTRLDGEVGVESEVGQGSTFWFTLPAAL